MAQVDLIIGGRSHSVACRDGEEAQLVAIGQLLDRHTAAAIRASGAQGGERMMLFLALMLADELTEHERGAAAQSAAPLPGTLLEEIADRLEAVAMALEEEPPNA